jgi:hypothetical protein
MWGKALAVIGKLLRIHKAPEWELNLTALRYFGWT